MALAGVQRNREEGQLPSPNDVRLLQSYRKSSCRAVQPPMPVNHKINSVLPLPEAFGEHLLSE